MEWKRDDGAVVSDDPSRLDLDRIWRWLDEESYWARGRSHETVVTSFANSIGLGLYAPDDQLIGCCRWVTDRATFAWLADVFVDDSARGTGLGTWLVECAMNHPDVQGLKRQLLATLDAHGLYTKFGFGPLTEPVRWMERAGGGH